MITGCLMQVLALNPSWRFLLVSVPTPQMYEALVMPSSCTCWCCASAMAFLLHSIPGLRAWDLYSALGLMSPPRLASFSCMPYFYLLAFFSFFTIATGSLCFVDSNNYTFVFSSFTVPFTVTFTVTFQVPIGSDLRFAYHK